LQVRDKNWWIDIKTRMGYDRMISLNKMRNEDIFSLLILVTSVTQIFWYVTGQVISLGVNSDYVGHHIFANKIVTEGKLTFLHFCMNFLSSELIRFSTYSSLISRRA
jgi:hypothetical protein